MVIEAPIVVVVMGGTCRFLRKIKQKADAEQGAVDVMVLLEMLCCSK
jgi:hypothetical protein